MYKRKQWKGKRNTMKFQKFSTYCYVLIFLSPGLPTYHPLFLSFILLLSLWIQELRCLRHRILARKCNTNVTCWSDRTQIPAMSWHQRGKNCRPQWRMTPREGVAERRRPSFCHTGGRHPETPTFLVPTAAFLRLRLELTVYFKKPGLRWDKGIAWCKGKKIDWYGYSELPSNALHVRTSLREERDVCHINLNRRVFFFLVHSFNLLVHEVDTKKVL